MGDKKFSTYNAKRNNCQDFVLSVLKANSMNNKTREKFIKQNAKDILLTLPIFTQKIIKFTTDIGAVFNRLVEGKGLYLI